MTEHVQTSELHVRIARMLDTPSAGNAVARELSAQYRAWQDRVLIGELRARRAQHRYDTVLDAQQDADDAMAARVTFRRRH